MINKKINKTQLCGAAGITTNAMVNLGRDYTVPLEALEKICETLNLLLLTCCINNLLMLKENDVRFIGHMIM